MSLIKLGSQLRIIKTAASVEELVMDRPLEEKVPGTKIIEPKHSDFLYYRARAISAGDQGPIGKDGSRTWNYNGNFDYFARKQLEASYESFVGRNIFLDHNSESSLYSIGKLIDAVPVDDPETGEFYIEIVGKIDRTLHPEICRKIETGELNSTSMGCSVDESKCSICGHILHSDADEKCEHLSHGLGKRYEAEIDIPEANIKQGEAVPCFSINSGIVFNEDSIVGVPADPSAVIKTVLSNMRHSLTKKASLSDAEKLDFVKQFENLLTKVDSDMAIKLKAEFCGICPSPIKESSMNDTNLPNPEMKKVLEKVSAYEMGLLESYVSMKTKKANEAANKEVVADATKKEETFLSKIVAKVKDSFAAQLLEKKVEAVAKEELGKEADKTEFVKCPNCDSIAARKVNNEVTCVTCGYGKKKEKKSSLSAKFNEDTKNVLASTWSVYEGDKLVLDASLKDIWGSQFETLSFADQKWATSEAYGKEAIARYQKEGVEKLADLWDVVNKLSKTAAEPKLGPSGTRATPTTGLSNKKHDYPTQPKFEKPGQEQGQKGPAAPAAKEVKTITKLDMPGQEKGQTGPAAPKAKEVKTDYSEPKPEAEGKEVKTTPKNPEEKKTEKSEKEVKTDYVAAGTEAMEAEEKGEKKEKSDKKSSLISWASLTPKAQESIKIAAQKYIESGMKNAEAVAKAHSEFTAQETDMKKQAADKPVESVDGSTLPKGKKGFGAEDVESVEKSTHPKGKTPSGEPVMSVEDGKGKKTPNLTKAPDESVQGTTLPKDHISKEKKDDESAKGTTYPSGKKTMGDESEQSVKKAAAEEKPEEAKKEVPPVAEEKKPAAPAAPKAESKPEAAPSIAQKEDGKAPVITDISKAPEESVEGTTLPEGTKFVGDKAEQSSQGDTQPAGTTVDAEPDASVNKTAATEMPLPEDKDPMSSVKDEAPLEEKPLDLPMGGPKVDEPAAEASAFDTVETLDIGEGYSARKDKESKEVIVEKDGQEVKRLPDGFGKDVAAVLPLMKAVLGLPPEEAKPEVPGMAAPVEEHKEEPKMEEHPAVEEAHEDELGMKESALKVKEAALAKKEAAIAAKEAEIKSSELAKKFAEVLKVRSERCKKIVADMVSKDAIQMDKAVFEAERQIGTYLLDAQKKAFEAAITAKQKELLAMDDSSLTATEKVVAELAAPVIKRASHIYVSPEFTAELSEDATIARIFNSMGTKQRPS